jgi:hypothetical protein
MTQTTDGMSFADVQVEYQIDGDTSPTDMSGFATSVEVSGYELQVGEAYTASGQTAILTAGKTQPAELTVNVIYTEKANDPTEKLWKAKEDKKKVKIIWYPNGKAAGDWKWESDYGFLTSVSAPGGEVSSADPILTTLSIRAPKIAKTVIAANPD